MADPSGTPRDRRPQTTTEITPASRGADPPAEPADLLLDDGFAPHAGATQPVRGPAVSVRSILRQKWLMLAVFVVVAGASIPCVWLFTVPLYESTALVSVQPVVSPIVNRTENTGMLPLYREYMNTQVNVIRNPKVLQRVLDRQEIQDTHWYRQEGRRPFREPVPVLERLAKSLQVQTRRDTQLISVSISTEKGADAKLIVDTVVNEYLKLVSEQEGQESRQLIGTIQEEHKKLELEIKGLRDLKRRISTDSGLMDSLELRAQLSTKLNDLESRSMEVQRHLALLNTRLKPSSASETQPAGSQPSEEIDRADYALDADWRQLDIAVKTAKHQLELTRDRYGNSHPNVKEMTSNVAHAESLLADREKQLDDERERQSLVPVSITDSSTGPISPEMIEQRETEKQLLESDISKLRGKVSEVQELAGIEEQLRDKTEWFAAVRTRLTTLDIESKAQGRVSRSAEGLVASEPDSDRRPLLSVMALGGAAMLALALAYLRSMSDSRIHEMGDIQTMGQAPFLGRLPTLAKTAVPKELGGPSTNSLLLCASVQNEQGSYPDPSTPTALLEGVRMIRTALLERLGGSPDRAVLITSPTSQAGKTSLSFLLARSLAVTGKTVLLVEGDFYRPALSSRLGLPPKPGLAALLTHRVDDANAIQTTAIPFLDVLPVGIIPEAFSTEVLANGVFADCMTRWKQAYDYIILDSPPLLPVADARILASHADGALLVLKASHNRRPEAWSAFNQLSATRGGVLGVVMIGGGAEVSGYHYGYSDYPYSKARTVVNSELAAVAEETSATGA